MLKKGTKIMLISQGDRPEGGLIRRNYDSLHCKLMPNVIAFQGDKF
jgi:hypothetical protein